MRCYLGHKMEWIKLPIDKVLRHPSMIGEEPATRSTYIYLLAWACSQECGGTIKGCADWSDRRWQQTAAVTKAEVEDLCATDMASWDGEDLVLWWYPEEAHAKVIANRENGKKRRKTKEKGENGAR